MWFETEVERIAWELFEFAPSQRYIEQPCDCNAHCAACTEPCPLLMRCVLCHVATSMHVACRMAHIEQFHSGEIPTIPGNRTKAAR